MSECMSIKHKLISFLSDQRGQDEAMMLPTKLCKENRTPVVIQVTGLEC